MKLKQNKRDCKPLKIKTKFNNLESIIMIGVLIS